MTGIMEADVLPAPIHMTGSFLFFAPLAFPDKLSIARALAAILLPVAVQRTRMRRSPPQ